MLELTGPKFYKGPALTEPPCMPNEPLVGNSLLLYFGIPVALYPDLRDSVIKINGYEI
jgi:hypothetical protein